MLRTEGRADLSGKRFKSLQSTGGMKRRVFKISEPQPLVIDSATPIAVWGEHTRFVAMFSATLAAATGIVWAALVDAAAISSSTTSPPITSFTSTASAPWQSTCLYSPQSGVNADCNRPGDPGTVDYLNPYDTVQYPDNISPANATLASFCSSLFLSDESVFYATASISTYTQAGYTYPAANDPSSSLVTVLAETNAFYPADWSFTASPPCCLDCTLFGGTVQVYDWPTPAPTPGVTALVNNDGYTFISPSVYVAFQSLYATDYCGPVATVYSTPHILAFNPTELSTAIAWTYNKHLYIRPLIMENTFTQANWGTLTSCPNITSTVWSLDAGGYTSFSDEAAATSAVDIVLARDTSAKPLAYEYVITYNPCSPTLSVPTQVFTINPAWRTCRKGIDAFYDPPSILTPATGLLSTLTASFASPTSSTAPVAQHDSTTSSQSVAAPGPTPTPVTVAPTTTPDPPAKPVTSSSTAVVAASSPDPPAKPATSSDPAVVAPAPSPNSSADPPASTTAVKPTNPASPNSPTLGQSTPNAPSPDPAQPASQGTSPAPVNPTSVPNSNPSALSTTSKMITATLPGTVISGHDPVAVSSSSSTSPAGATYAIGSQTLVAGASAITVSGTVISLASSGNIVVGGQTTAMNAATTSGAVGGIILSVGGFTAPITTVTAAISSTAAFNGTTFTGAASRGRSNGNGLVWGAFAVFGLWEGALMIMF